MSDHLVPRGPLKPEDVFTPRSPRVNKFMYVNRTTLERKLKRAIRSGKNIIIFGESGSGKSWLYKEIFDEEGIYHVPIDLTSVKNSDDFDLRIFDVIASLADWKEATKKDVNELKITPFRVGTSDTIEIEYKKHEKSAAKQLVELVEYARQGKRSFIVLENMEQAIIKPEVVDVIKLFIMSIDNDPNFGGNCQILLVGVPSDIKELVSSGKRFQTILNRLVEMPEVSAMSKAEAYHLITKGLEQSLGFSFLRRDYCIERIMYITQCLPQHLQDLCLHIAWEAEERMGDIDIFTIDSAARNWIDETARQHRSLIEKIYHSRKKGYDRQMQVIFASAVIKDNHFSAKEVGEAMKKHFPRLCGGKTLGLQGR